MEKISEDQLKAISSIFDGDIKNLYSYKSGPQIFKFFNHYFGFSDTYSFNNSYPSRWAIVSQKLIQIDQQKKLGSFFEIILSRNYLAEENPNTSNDKLMEIAAEAQRAFNLILESSGLEIVDSDGKRKLTVVDLDLMFLGEGGFAKCYLRHSDGKVVKFLKEEYYSDATVVSRFKREYRITKSLQEFPGVIRVFDFDEKRLSYTMELAEKDLFHFISENPDLKTDIRTTIFFQILSTMQQVHGKSVIHRDLTPNNIFLFSGFFKIADFGLGKNYLEVESHKTTSTSGSGTLLYCDPRQLESLKDGGDSASDIFALGRILNFLMTGDPLNENHIYRQVYEKATTPNLELRYKMPQEMGDAITQINKCIADKKYQEKMMELINMGTFSAEIAQYIQTIEAGDLFDKIQGQKFLAALEQTLNSGVSDDYVLSCLIGIKETIDGSYRLPFELLDPPGYLSLFILKNHFSYPAEEAAVNLLNCSLSGNRFGIRRATDEFLHANPDFSSALREKIIK